jgi:ABC-type transport system substrate-binding protein
MSSSSQNNDTACIRIGLPKIYRTYDPSELQTTPQVFVIYALGGTLVRVGDNNQYYSGIAESWKLSPEGAEIVLKISKNAKFSDGSPITSDDVATSLKRAVLYSGTHVNLRDKLLDGEQLKTIQDSIRGIEISDNRTIVLRTKKKEMNFLAWLSFPETIIMPQEEALKAKMSLSFEKTAGPYTLHKSTETEIELRSNPFFYEEHSSAANCIIVKGYDDSEHAIAALRRKEIDLLDYGAVLDPGFQQIINDNRAFSFTNGFSNALAYFILNTKRSVFGDRKNRLAFFDRISGNQELIPYGKSSIFKPTKQFLPDTQAGFMKDERLKEVLSEMVNFEDHKFNTEDVTVLYPAVFGEKYQSLLKSTIEGKTSLKVNFINYKEGEILSALEKNNYDAFFCIAGMGEKDTEILLDYHFNGKLPLYSFTDSTILQLLNEAKKATEKKLKISLYQKISEQLIRQAYVVPIAHFSWPIFHRSDLYYKRANEFQLTNDLWRLSWR